MKKLLLLAAVVILSFSVFSQEIFIEQSIVINVEVPVRVFKDGAFVDNLTTNDFEIFEDSISQKIEAVYLVKKRSIDRSEEKKRFTPKTSRSFYLFFEVAEYTPKLGNAVSYFIHNVIFPGDNLFIITPLKTYRLKDRALEVTTREILVNRIIKFLRNDTLQGNSEYRNIIDDLSGLAKTLSEKIKTGTLDTRGGDARTINEIDNSAGIEYEAMDFDEQLVYYAALMGKLETLRYVNQTKLLEFSKILKDKEGQKYIFMFYQREFIPQIEPRILTQYITMYQGRPDILSTITGLFDFHKRDISFDIDLVKKAFADASASIHFLFITRPAPETFGVHMQEHSEDIFTAFNEMAKATGGFVESSSNPAFLFKKAVEASENYYLLYYSPKNYEFDGKFKEIKVRVKNKEYKVIHRAGYFAN